MTPSHILSSTSIVYIQSGEHGSLRCWIRFLPLTKDMWLPQIHNKSRYRPLVLLRKDEGPRFFVRTGDCGPTHLSNTRTCPLFLWRRGEKSLPSSRTCDGPTSPTRMSDGPLYPWSTRDWTTEAHWSKLLPSTNRSPEKLPQWNHLFSAQAAPVSTQLPCHPFSRQPYVCGCPGESRRPTLNHQLFIHSYILKLKNKY